MLETAGLAKWKSSTDPIKQKMQFEKGFLWERIIQYILQSQMDRDIQASIGRLSRPGEYTSNGVIGTPDAIDGQEWHLEEWKATAISPSNLTADTLLYKKPEWGWAAGWHLEYFGMDSVIYRIWHHREFDPTIKQYKVSFLLSELRDNKERILNHAKTKGWL